MNLFLCLLLLQVPIILCSFDNNDITKNSDNDTFENGLESEILDIFGYLIRPEENNVDISTASANATEEPAPQLTAIPTPKQSSASAMNPNTITIVSPRMMSIKELSQHMHVMPTEEISIQLDLLGDRMFDPIYDHCKWTVLHEAVSTDNLDFVRMFLSRATDTSKFDINAFDSYFGSVLYYVKSVKMVRLLKEFGANLKNPTLSCHRYPSAQDVPQRTRSIITQAVSELEADDFEFRVAAMVVELKKKSSKRSQKITFTREEMYQKMLVSLPKRKMKHNSKIYIEFRNEIGVDHGGPTRDFIGLLKRKLVEEKLTLESCPDFGYWKLKTDAPSDRVRLFGYIVGLSIAHQVPLNMKFSPFLYHLMCDLNPHRDIDLTALLFERPEYRQAFDQMKNSTLEELNGIYEEFPADPEDVLRPWKRQRSQSRFESKTDIMEFFRLKAREIFIQPIAHIMDDFVSGIEAAIDPKVIRKYVTPAELPRIISGEVDYTAEEWKSLAKFKGNRFYKKYYDQFFEIVDEMTPSERGGLLKFVFALEALPHGGFASLVKVPEVMVVQQAESYTYPMAATCFNKITIFPAKSKKEMKEILLKAIELGKDSFDMA